MNEYHIAHVHVVRVSLYMTHVYLLRNHLVIIFILPSHHIVATGPPPYHGSDA
jgi:hypothetical protein